MDKKSKILLWFFLLLIVGSVAVTYWRIMIKKDYVIEGQVDCDPYVETCFVWECDPESSEEGEACTGDAEEDIWYFKVARRSAANIPLCDPNTDENCDPWTCEEGEEDCSEEFCTEENMEAQYASSCVDPVQYSMDNPIEEEECEEGDEECEVEEECVEGDEECEVEEECVEGDEECEVGLEEVICEEGDEECLSGEESSEGAVGEDAEENEAVNEESDVTEGESATETPAEEVEVL